MRRYEAMALVVAGLVSTTAGLTWLTGPWGLLIAGSALLFLSLFVFDVRE